MTWGKCNCLFLPSRHISTKLLIFLQALMTVTIVTAQWSSTMLGRPKVWNLSCHGATVSSFQRREGKVGSKGKLTCPSADCNFQTFQILSLPLHPLF